MYPDTPTAAPSSVRSWGLGTERFRVRTEPLQVGRGAAGSEALSGREISSEGLLWEAFRPETPCRRFGGAA